MDQPVVKYDEENDITQLLYRDICMLTVQTEQTLEHLRNYNEGWIERDIRLLDALLDHHLLDYLMNSTFKHCSLIAIKWGNVINRYGGGEYKNGYLRITEPNGDLQIIKDSSSANKFIYNDYSIAYKWIKCISCECKCGLCNMTLKNVFCRRAKSAKNN